MNEIKRRARFAGILYTLANLAAPFAIIYLPSLLIVPGDATATADHVRTSIGFVRMGIAAELINATVIVFAALAFYRLFKAVDHNQATLMVILGGLMVAPIYFLNSLNDAAALLLARGADFLSVFQKPQRDAIAMLFLRLHHHGVVANEIFWGLWLFPLALLVLKSGFFPRFLGVWLIINGFAYVIDSFTGLLLPQYEDMVSNIMFPALFGELAFMLWLVIKGAKVQPLAVAPA